MIFRLLNRSAFSICGYSMETSLETCGMDLRKLWKDYGSTSQKLYNVFGVREDFYGLMWKTKTSKSSYIYLIGIEVAETKKPPEKAEIKQIPPAKYAVASVPASLSAVDAWNEFYNNVLTESEYTPAVGHVFDYEYYPHGDGNDYELWTPVQKKG